MACFPVLAQAERISVAQYETEVPDVPGPTKPPKQSERTISGTPSSSNDGGANAPELLGTTNGSGIWSRRQVAHRSGTAVAAIQARATVAVPARVTQATAPPADSRSALGEAQAGRHLAAAAAGRRRRLLLAAGPDPDRDRRSGGDLDRRGRGQAASSACRTAPGLAEGELARCRNRGCKTVDERAPARRPWRSSRCSA